MSIKKILQKNSQNLYKPSPVPKKDFKVNILLLLSFSFNDLQIGKDSHYHERT